MKFQVDTQNIVLVDKSLTLVSGTSGHYIAEFEFSDEWEGYTKTAVFLISSGVTELGLLINDQCAVPAAALTEGCYFRMGVYGVKDELSYPTVWSETIRVQEGCSEVIDTVAPDENFLNTMLTYVGTAAASANAAAQSAAAAEEIAEDLQTRASQGDFTGTIEVGTVTTGAPGTDASVFNSGSSQRAVLDFTIPQGLKGDRGYTGAPGMSAYEYAVAGGYTGTEVQFKESIANGAMVVPLTIAEIDQIVDRTWEGI